MPTNAAAGEIAVVGGGPAGLASAIACAMRGFSVRVYAAPLPHDDKACGEVLLPKGVAALSALGVELSPTDGARLERIRYCEGRTVASGTFARPAYGVARAVLIQLLLRRAASLGVRMLAARIKDVEPSANGVRFFAAAEADAAPLYAGRPDELGAQQAAYLIGADGLSSHVRRAVGLGGTRGPVRRIGMRHHVRIADWPPDIEIHFGSHGDVCVTPVGRALVNVNVLTSKPHLGFEAALASVPALQARLSGGTVIDRLRGAGPLWQRAHNAVAGRVALVGDAAGYVDAITGEGVSIALQSATALAASLQGPVPLRGYARRRRRLTRIGSLHARLLLGLTGWPRVRRGVLWLLSRAGGLLTLWVRLATAP